MKRKSSSKAAKKIVYLFGAGATQAVLKSINPGLSLLTPDIQEKISRTYFPRTWDKKIWSELISVSDIEHLISVLESQHHYHASEQIRKYYMEAIIDIAKDVSKNPPIKNLYSVLIDLHKNVTGLNEKLLCFITLNYEDILERTIESLFGLKINYLLHSDNSIPTSDDIKVLKLHGSFNWQNTRPVTMKSMTTIKSSDALWIPPGVEKRKDNYPFNLLWGQATENLMQCDTLRIIGCSLSRNDWGLIPILYTVQRFNNTGKTIDIEIIDYPLTAKNIITNYKYMKFVTITELHEFLNYYKKQFPKAKTSGELIAEIEAKFFDKDKSNPFYEWLDAKIDYLSDDRKMDIKTPNNIVYNFYNKL
ncbi:MAG: hypothetical protein HZB30_12670 [Nitrospirae bacterium]|nr:hypothetical protein [Nitrospirota bacterium]